MLSPENVMPVVSNFAETLRGAAAWGFEQGIRDIGRVATIASAVVVASAACYSIAGTAKFVAARTETTTNFFRRTWREAGERNEVKHEFQEFLKKRNASKQNSDAQAEPVVA
jgi:hypothetical protein